MAGGQHFEFFHTGVGKQLGGLGFVQGIHRGSLVIGIVLFLDEAGGGGGLPQHAGFNDFVDVAGIHHTVPVFHVPHRGTVTLIKHNKEQTKPLDGVHIGAGLNLVDGKVGDGVNGVHRFGFDGVGAGRCVGQNPPRHAAGLGRLRTGIMRILFEHKS